MAQIFPKWTNTTPLRILGALAGGGLLIAAGSWYYLSPEFLEVGYMPRQPVPYSHALHVGELGLDCRYCHSMVERSAIAGVPPTQTCMNCHRLVARDAETLEPIRASAQNGERMRWIRVHDLPEYAYFDHSVHLAAGVGCSSCHGDVAAMEEVVQVEPLSMRWCLECHRDPDPHLRPREELTNTTWEPPADQTRFAAQVREAKGIAPSEDCGTCHR